MSEGINLSRGTADRRRSTARRAGAVLVAAALAGSVVHLFVLFEARSATRRMLAATEEIHGRLRETEREIGGLRSRLRAPESQPALRRILSVSRSGAAGSAMAIEVLDLMAEALPARARLRSLSLETGPTRPPAVTMDVVAAEDTAARELLEALLGSALVARADVLEERTESAGDIGLRLKARLRRPGEAAGR